MVSTRFPLLALVARRANQRGIDNARAALLTCARARVELARVTKTLDQFEVERERRALHEVQGEERRTQQTAL